MSRAYIAGGIINAEYEAKLDEIDANLRLTENVELHTLEEGARLFGDIPQLWEEAAPEKTEVDQLDFEASLRGHGE